MSNGNRQQQKKYLLKMSGLLLGFCLTVGVNTGTVHAEGTESAKLQNGSFEEGQDVTTWTRDYQQPNQSSVPSWNTTAKEGKIELLKENTGTYITGVTLKPTNGSSIAAELNADEESTLYQNVRTTPSSIYTWGLDHGARNGTDTMALVIGPKQDVDPSKPSKTGRDQLMQMVDWLIDQGKTSIKTSATSAEQVQQLTVYSKKFAANGTFLDNAGNNAFSLTPSSVYTEEWKIWIMADSRATSGTNPWGKYGTNAEGTAGSAGSSGNTTIDMSKYYLYTVPAEQTETLFGFVSVGCVDDNGNVNSNKTFGNFLDNINFQLYHPLSGSTSYHGSGVVGGSDGTAGGGGASSTGYEITVDHNLITYVAEGEPLKVQAVVTAEDAGKGCEFVGLNYTKRNELGNLVTQFLQKTEENVIVDTGSLTEEQKNGKWIKSINSNGDIIYTYYLANLTSATDLHFVFIKSPTVTYDPNGGQAYSIDRTTYPYNIAEASNVYSFKPVKIAENKYTFIPPYVSHAATGQNDGWKFMGWLLTGDTVAGVSSSIQINADQLGTLLLPAEHTLACNYSVSANEQYFKIWNGNEVSTLTETIDDSSYAKWEKDGAAYANVHKGLTMVAQWRWRQAFIPQVKDSAGNCTNPVAGGTVEITSVTDTSDSNYNAAYTTVGGKSYHAETNEVVTAKATANPNFTFEGWYDSGGRLLTTNNTYSYTETKGSVNTFYARFSGNVTQTYIRQVRSGDSWSDTTENAIGTIDRYTYIDGVGSTAVATATAGTGYKFMGWYDVSGNKITGDKISSDGRTLTYTTTGNATYYARFERTVTQTYKRQVGSGNSWSNTTDNTVGTLNPYSHIDVKGAEAVATATAGTGYKFMGWYDAPGSDANKVSDSITLRYNTAGDATYYARFSQFVTQTYKRQVGSGNSWSDTTDNAIGTLDRESHYDVVGTTAGAIATAGTGYKFVGWYDASGHKVSDTMVSNEGRTLGYITTENATYYARFERIASAGNTTGTNQGNTGSSQEDDSSSSESDIDFVKKSVDPVKPVATGDNSRVELYVGLLIISALCVALLDRVKKKKQDGTE